MKKIITTLALAATLSATTASAQTFTEAFDYARGTLGPNATFTFEGKEYSTQSEEERLYEQYKGKTGEELNVFIKKARALYKKAAKEKIDWVDTRKIMISATKAFKAGKWEEALDKAIVAHFQARTALELKEENKKKWIKNVPPFN